VLKPTEEYGAGPYSRGPKGFAFLYQAFLSNKFVSS